MVYKREADFGILMRHWLRANPLYTCSLEAKQTTTDSIPFSDVSPAQIDWALAIESQQGVLLRVQAVAEGMPDYIYMRNETAYIVIKYPDFFCLIRIGVFVLESKASKRRSLTSARAREICTVAVEL